MQFFSYFTKVENIVQIIEFVFFAILAFNLYLRTGDIKRVKTFLSSFQYNFKEDDMKYRTENYQDKEPVKGQCFDAYLKTYRLNKVTNELEETEPIDIQEMINSSLSTCMSEVLSKFFPDQVSTEEDDRVALVEEMQDDLDYLQDTYAIAQKYSEMFDLDPTLSMQQIFDFVSQKSKELSDSLNKSNETKTEVNVNENAQKNEQESK